MLTVEQKDTLRIEIHSTDTGTIQKAISYLSEFLPYGEFTMSHKKGRLCVEFVHDPNGYYSFQQVSKSINSLFN